MSYTYTIRDDFPNVHPTRWHIARCTGQYGKTITQDDIKVSTQVVSSGQQLNLTADTASIDDLDDFGAAKTYLWKSGGIQSWNSFAFRYGEVEIRYKPALNTGLISTAYLLPFTNNITFEETWPPEIDLFETDGGIGSDGVAGSNTYYTAHYKDGDGANQQDQSLVTTTAGWRTVRVVWDADLITWYEDGRIVHQYTNGPKNQRQPIDCLMYLIIELRVGSWFSEADAGDTWPQTMQVDYVQIQTDELIQPFSLTDR